MKKVLVDASSAILLFKTGLFEILLDSYALVMTESVRKELTVVGYPGARLFDRHFQNGRIEVKQWGGGKDDGSLLFPDVPSMGAGERDTICRYLTGAADFILIDDARGAGYCRKKSIPYVNALLMPRIMWLSRKIAIAEYQQHVRELVRIGRYSGWIRDFAMNCSSRELDFFLP